ncbi:cyclase family protein [Paraglaciecola sp.]|uniref:cyclase family protein n=2 Tax=Paraglaciecola sp. TaxID=1920173 RepID=UPI00329A60E3
MTKVVDLSKAIQFNNNDPYFMQVKISHKPHWMARWLVRFLGLPFKLMPKDFVGWADDTITKMGVHSTTHIDAPWHYGPKNGDEKAESIEKMPLDKCIGPGIVFDMTHKADGEAITVLDMQEAVAKHDLVIEPDSIALIRTDRDKYMGTKHYCKRGTGMGADATEWLIDQGITVMGIDQWGWDIPFHYQIKQAKEQNRDDLFWEGHRIGQRKPYWQMEQLVNLSSLPYQGFKVCVFPLKLVGASAAPARVVALFEG